MGMTSSERTTNAWASTTHEAASLYARALKGGDGERREWSTKATAWLADDREGAEAFAAARRQDDPRLASMMTRDLLERTAARIKVEDHDVDLQWLALKASSEDALDYARANASQVSHGSTQYMPLPISLDPKNLLWSITARPAAFTESCKALIRQALDEKERALAGRMEAIALEEPECTYADGTLAALVPVVRARPSSSRAVVEDWTTTGMVNDAGRRRTRLGPCGHLAQSLTWPLFATLDLAHPPAEIRLRTSADACRVVIDGVEQATIDAMLMMVVGDVGLEEYTRIARRLGTRVDLDDAGPHRAPPRPATGESRLN